MGTSLRARPLARVEGFLSNTGCEGAGVSGSVLRVVASRRVRVAICAGCLWWLPGCAVVNVVDADGKQETRLQASAFESVNPPADRPRHVKVTALGISTTSKGFDVGLRNEDLVIAPPGCHAVLIVNNEMQAETAAKLAKLVNESCVVRR